MANSSSFFLFSSSAFFSSSLFPPKPNSPPTQEPIDLAPSAIFPPIALAPSQTAPPTFLRPSQAAPPTFLRPSQTAPPTFLTPSQAAPPTSFTVVIRFPAVASHTPLPILPRPPKTSPSLNLLKEPTVASFNPLTVLPAASHVVLLTTLTAVDPRPARTFPLAFNTSFPVLIPPLRASPPTLRAVSTTADFSRSLSTPPFTASNPFFTKPSLLVSFNPSLGSASAAMLPKSFPSLSVTCHVPSLF